MVPHISDSHQIQSQNKTKSKLEIIKEPIIKIFKFSKKNSCDTPPDVAWNDAWIWNGSNQNCRRYRTVTGCGTDRWTDEWTDRWTEGEMDWNQYTPQHLCCEEGKKIYSFHIWPLIVFLKYICKNFSLHSSQYICYMIFILLIHITPWCSYLVRQHLTMMHQ